MRILISKASPVHNAPDAPNERSSQGIGKVIATLGKRPVDPAGAFPAMATPSQLVGQTISPYRVLESWAAVGWVIQR
jgi:hypothetical protein